MARQAKLWKHIATKTLLEGGKFNVVEDTVILPDGTTTTYDYIPSKVDSVIIIAINRRGNVLLQREYSHPPRKIMWQLPGGSMNTGESITEAAKRELAEESAYGTQTCEVIGWFYANNRNSNKKQYVVLCQDLYKNKLQEDFDEFIDSYWVTPKKLNSMIETNKIHNINLLAALNIWFHKK